MNKEKPVFNEPNAEHRLFPKEEVDKIYKAGHMSGGHGTTLELAPDILTNGIRVNSAYGLHEIIVPLSGMPTAQLESLLAAWPHRNAQAIVIVCVPDAEGFHHPRDIVGSIFDERTGRDRSYVPPQFIKGYFDTTQKKFIENPAWEADPTPIEKPEPVAPKPNVRAKTTENVVNNPEPNPDSADDNEVW